MVDAITLPVGPEPNWEQREEGGPPLRSIAESGVLLLSLQQSRERWLSCAFAKFSSRAQGKQPEVVPPPHTATPLGQCDLHIGPHIFYDTALFDVQFHQPVYGAGPSGTFLPTATKPNGPAMPITPAPPIAQAAAAATAAAAAAAESEGTPPPLNPAFLAHVYQTASTNPQLAELLTLSITNRASPDQVRTLGLILHAMATGPASVQLDRAQDVPGVPPELVLEFRERMGERWLVPRHLAVCERKVSEGGTSEVVVTTALFPASAAQQAEGQGPEPQVVTLRLAKAPLGTWDFVQRWADQEKVAENSRVLDQLTKEASRVYLQYRLPDGPLLTAIQDLVNPAPPMRPLNPTDKPPVKRKQAPRKHQTVPAIETPALPVDKGKAKIATLEVDHLTPRALAKGKNKECVHDATDVDPIAMPPPPPAKRRRASQKEKVKPSIIVCQACGMMDVPLLLGGHYCRNCIDDGKTSLSSTVHVQRQTYPPQANSSVGKP